MILNQHNDGTCFKLTIVYTDYEDSEPFSPHIRWCEDFNGLVEYGLKSKSELETEYGHYVIDFRIQDDSK